ncbi:MFS transporter [Microbacterium testaceum]|uniref:MFS transporter n=1 Tax=Microbacterium testaceum TaxID=2033 RepID=UPI001652B553|nr:MFS transporter [Microbacterium testaceum]
MDTKTRRRHAPRGGLLSARYRALVIGLVVLVATSAFSRLGISTALPSAAAELDGQALYGAVLSTFTVANIVGLCLAGPMFDRFGIVKPLVVGVAFFAGGLLVATLAPSMAQLVAGRGLQGFGAGALSIASYTAIAQGIPAERRPAMLAVNASAFTIPSMVGPVAAGALTDAASWRVVFALLVPLAPLALLLARTPLRRIDADAGRSSDTAPRLTVSRKTLLGCLTFGGGVVAILLTPAVGAGAAWGVLAAGLVVSLIGLSRLMPRGTLRLRRGLPAHMTFAIGLSLAFFTTDLYLPLALTDLIGVSSGLAGAALTAGVIGWTGGAYVPAAVRRFGAAPSVLGVCSAVLVLLGMTGIALTILLDLPFFLILISWAVAGCGAGVGFTSNAAAVLDLSASEPGKASSQMEVGNQAGIAIGTGVAGVIVAAAGVTGITMAQTLLVGAVGGAVALVAALRFAVADS